MLCTVFLTDPSQSPPGRCHPTPLHPPPPSSKSFSPQKWANTTNWGLYSGNWPLNISQGHHWLRPQNSYKAWQEGNLKIQRSKGGHFSSDGVTCPWEDPGNMSKYEQPCLCLKKKPCSAGSPACKGPGEADDPQNRMGRRPDLRGEG